MKKIILITGGQRSGKSMYAERLALSLTDQPIYFATARIWDEEFKERVKRHQARRGDNWTNIEEEKYLSQHTIYNKVCVVDCITLWCTNFFFYANQLMRHSMQLKRNLIYLRPKMQHLSL